MFNYAPYTIRNELKRGTHPHPGRYSASHAQRAAHDTKLLPSIVA